jgi:hypothetical protein
METWHKALHVLHKLGGEGPSDLPEMVPGSGLFLSFAWVLPPNHGLKKGDLFYAHMISTECSYFQGIIESLSGPIHMKDSKGSELRQRYALYVYQLTGASSMAWRGPQAQRTPETHSVIANIPLGEHEEALAQYARIYGQHR